MSEQNKNDQYEDFLAGIDQMNQAGQREQHFLEGISSVSGTSPAAEELDLLGERVKTIREQKGLSLADVASRTGFEESFLGKIESGEVSPPLGDLIKLGRALGLKMGYFISGGETKTYTVVRSGERQKVARRASSQDKAYGYTYMSLAPGKANRQMEPFLITLEPAPSEELSSHEGQEFIFIMSGKMEAILDRDRIVLEPGDAIYYDSNVPHLVRCVDGPSTQILAVIYAPEK
ncbi:MAG: cupin domain-containing protein [Thermodesulfobacteriota bacterium]